MLRWVARVFRIVLFSVGTLLLALVALSFFTFITIRCPWPTARGSEDNWQVVVFHIGDEVRHGTLRIAVLESEITHQRRFTWRVTAERAPLTGFGIRWKPSWHHSHPFAVLNLPLWLLAFLCLAWPVTSFIVARRRRRSRGFEVEASGGRAVSTVDS